MISFCEGIFPPSPRFQIFQLLGKMRKQEKWNVYLAVYRWECAQAGCTELISTRMVLCCSWGNVYYLSASAPLRTPWRAEAKSPFVFSHFTQLGIVVPEVAIWLLPFHPSCFFMQHHGYCWGLSVWVLKVGNWELVKLPPCSQQCATPQSSHPTLVLVIVIYLPVRSRHYTWCSFSLPNSRATSQALPRTSSPNLT